MVSIEEKCAAAATGLTIPLMLRRNADEHPQEPAVSDQERTFTWSELREDVARMAEGLRGLGLGRGDRMIIMMSSRAEHWVVDLAAVHLAAIPCTAYATLSSDQVGFIARHSRAKVIVLEGADQLDRWLPAMPQLPDVEHVLVLDEDVELPDQDTRFVRWSTAYEQGRSSRQADPSAFETRWTDIRPDDPLCMMYTSGTTGNPKGVVISHHNAVYEAAAVDITAPTPPLSRSVAYLPLAHVAERELGIYRALYKTLHVSVCPDPSKVVETLAFVRPPAFFGVPRVWEKIANGLQGALERQPEPQRRATERAREVALDSFRLRSSGEEVPAETIEQLAEHDANLLRPVRAMLGLDALQWASSGSAPISVSVLEILASVGIEVLEVWGMTETTGCATINAPEEFKVGTVGRPLPGMQVRIADDGEIFVRGPVVFLGYLDENGKIVSATDEDGWLATGDIGTVDDDGYLTITDRKKELIITDSGKNIAPTRIEGMLRAHPLIGQAVAIGDRLPYVTALITLDEEGAPAWAASKGISGGIGELAAHPEVRAEVDSIVAEVNSQLARAEQIKNHELLHRAWNAESGELTPTLKLRRKVVHDRYSEVIESLYTV